MKQISFLLILLLSVAGASAKTSYKTLWEGTNVNGTPEINISSSSFTGCSSGDIIRITFSFTTAGSLHLCYKIDENDGWKAHALDGISEWPHYSNIEVTSADFSINSADAETLSTYGMYVYGFQTSTITKIELIHNCTPSSTGDNLLSETWTPTEESDKEFDALAGAKIGDVILVNITCPENWAWTEFYVRDKDGNDFVNVGNYGKSYATETADTYEYEITNLADLRKICEEGFIIRAKVNCSITSVKLLSYSDSYGYVTVTISDAGYATWSSDKKYDFATAGITAYYASAVDQGTVTLTSMDITWDYQGYILKGTPGLHYVLQSLTDDGTSYYPNENYLKYNITSAEITASTDGTYHYIFAWNAGNTSTIGFYKLTDGHTLAANKAYLETTTDIAPEGDYTKAISLVFDDLTDGISTVMDMPERENAFYTLSGMRVTNPTRGLYIVNGRKVLVK